MFHGTIKDLFLSAVSNVASRISQFVSDPKKDLSRNRKLPSAKLIRYLVSQGASGTRNELLDFFGMSGEAPTASALSQQRAKLKTEALEAVFKQFNSSAHPYMRVSKYRLLAADGSSFTFFSKPSIAQDEYFVSEGHSRKGFYSMHLNALFDIENRVYTSASIQPIHSKDEFRAFCEMVDGSDAFPGVKNVYIGDRGYCSYNNMAHVIESGQYFLFRTKDIHSKGMVGKFDFPDSDYFDITVKVCLVRRKPKNACVSDAYMRFVDKATSFDYVEYGSEDSYELSFRVVRFPLAENSYECVVTNLPSDEFDMKKIRQAYDSRWAVETSFRKLKYTIGLSNFHTCKPECVKQEIWAKMLAYNITEILINHAVVTTKNTVHAYKVNFTVASHICIAFLRQGIEDVSMDVMSLIEAELVPIRDGRQYPRLMTAHFRRPRYFTYRAA